MEVAPAGQSDVQQSSSTQEESESSKEVRVEGSTVVESSSSSSRSVSQSVTQKVVSSSMVKQSSFSSTTVSSSQQDLQPEAMASLGRDETQTQQQSQKSEGGTLWENGTESTSILAKERQPPPCGPHGPASSAATALGPQIMVATVTTQHRILNLNGEGAAVQLEQTAQPEAAWQPPSQQEAAEPQQQPPQQQDATWQPPPQQQDATWQPPPQQQDATWQPPPQQQDATWQPPPQQQDTTWQPPAMQEDASSQAPVQSDTTPSEPVKDCSDLPQDNIKSSLKEIICDLERADLADGVADGDVAAQTGLDGLTSQGVNHSANHFESLEERRSRMDRQTSTTTLEQTLLKEHQDGTLAALAALLSPAARTSVTTAPPPAPPSPPPPPRQPKIPLHNLAHLLQSVQIAHELNMVMNRTDESSLHKQEIAEEQYINHIPDDDRSRGGPAHIDLERLFTPATDSGESTPKRSKSRIFASSSFYGPEHPTVEEQVELARRISSSLSDVSNQRSKGQTMYVNRKKRSTGWVHAATDEGHASVPNTPAPDAVPSGPERDKPVLKLVMDPRGQVQDLWSLQKQGVPVGVDPSCGALSPEVCFHLVRDLNAPKGKGAELFAKRRKKSEKWVVDETTVRTSSSMMSSMESTSPAPKLPVPAPSYLTNGTSKVHTVQKMNEIQMKFQEKFSQPRVKLVKSPWEAALETGSVDTAFIETPKLPGSASTPAPAPTFAPAPSFAPAPPPRTPATGTPTWTATTTGATVRPLSMTDASLYTGRTARGWGQQNASQHYGDSALLSFRGPPEEPAPLLLREAQGPQGPQGHHGHAASAAPEPPPRTVFMDYSLLQNYNTAPRGWGTSMDYYRPVTFSKPIAATDL